METISLLLLLGFHFFFISVVSASTSTSTEPLVSLPIEIRDLLFTGWNLIEYGQFLLSSPLTQQLRATDFYEKALLTRSAMEIGAIERSRAHDVDTEHMDSLIRHACILIRLHSRLPIAWTESEESTTKLMARHFMQFYNRCALLSPLTIWHITCFASLVGDNTLRTLYPHLSISFCKQHQILMMQAAALIGDYDALEKVVNSSHLGWTITVAYIAPFLAQNGSTELFTKVSSHVSPDALPRTAFHENLIKFNKIDLLEHYLHGLDENALFISEYVQKLCELMCLYQRTGMIQTLATLVPQSLDTIDLNHSLQSVIKAGNCQIFKVLLGDCKKHTRRNNQRIRNEDIAAMLKLIAESNRSEMLDFLLDNYQPPLEALQEDTLRLVFAEAAKCGHFAVMESLLGAKRDGRSLINDLGQGDDQDPILTGVALGGHISVLEYLLARRATGDRRFAKLDIAANINRLFRLACGANRLGFVRFLLRLNPETGEFLFPNVDPAGALVLVARWGQLDVIRELLSQDHTGAFIYSTVDPAVDDNLPLLQAVCCSHHAVVEFLLQTTIDAKGKTRYRFPGIDVAARNFYIIHTAVERRDLKLLAFLMRRDQNRRFLLPGMQIPLELVAPLQELRML